MRNLRFFSFASLIMMTTACITTNTMQRANTVGKDKTQIAVEASFWGLAESATTTNADGTPGTTTDFVALPDIGVAVRYGLTDRIDIGGRLSGSGIEGMAKFQLTPPGASVILSLAPQIGGIYIVGASSGTDGGTGGAGCMNASLPLLIGIPVGEHQLVLTPKIVDFMIFGGSSDGGGGLVNVLSIGASVGFAFRITPNFQLLPEVAVLYPVGGAAASDGSTSGSLLSPNGAIFQAGLGFLWGGS